MADSNAPKPKLPHTYNPPVVRWVVRTTGYQWEQSIKRKFLFRETDKMVYLGDSASDFSPDRVYKSFIQIFSSHQEACEVWLKHKQRCLAIARTEFQKQFEELEKLVDEYRLLFGVNPPPEEA